jgi:hypothetical protein
MKRKFIENELKREVNSMLPENMVAEIKKHNVQPEIVNNNISVIHEKNKRSFVPMIAACAACLIICLAVFLPVVIQSTEKYNNWLAQQQQQEQQQEESTEDQSSK